VAGPGRAAGPAGRLIIGDPGRIDQQKTWLRILTGAVIACLTPTNLLAAARLQSTSWRSGTTLFPRRTG
jgi:hypothetical protein